ncbi:MAG: hypothetical protein JWQ25_1328 [Daejeonella sp.]|nr:hypothetical protein [Daejeonella sp.]
MLKNYFKIAWRNIVKHRFHSVVNIVGLFTGIAFTMLIGAYLWTELQVNHHLKNSNRQYFLESEWKDPNLGVNITSLAPLAKRLKENYPDLVANYYRWDGITSVVSKADKHFREGIQLGDSTLLSMFGFELLHGNSQTALVNPYSAVISADKAIKYFGKTDVVGQTISIQSFSGNTHDFSITGVLKETPENSVTQLNDNNHSTIFIPTSAFSYFGRADFESWANQWVISYVELKENVTPKDLENPIKQLIQQIPSDIIKQNLKVHPVKLTDFYLNQDNGLVKRMLYTLSAVGIFILLMAIVNFINITISGSETRMREIGVRKVLGSLRKQLIFQFLTESVVLVLIATVLAIAAYPVLKPFFSQIVGKNIPDLVSFPTNFILLPAIVVLVVGLTAGFYPAFILSSLKSTDSLKGKSKSGIKGILMRKSLVGFQFCIAIVVLIAATIITQQVSYFFGQSLGYNKDYIVSSQVPRNWSAEGVRKMEIIRNEFAAMPQVSNVTLSYEIPNGMNGGNPPVYKMGTDSTNAIAMQGMITDENYLDTYQIPLKAGSFFDTKGLDSGKVVLNEKAALALGWKTNDQAIGKQIRIPGDNTVFTVKGIANDFHFGSMKEQIKPIIFFNVKWAINHRYLSFRIKPGNISTSIAAIEKKWSALLPGSSFEYSFMDDTLLKIYSTEVQLKKAAYTATILSIIIVFLGILGIVSLSLHKRVKEIGIRKVLGATLPDITMLFVKEFIAIILIAGLVACPIAYFIMQEWLTNYADRISISPLPFICSIAFLGAMVLLLIGFQTIKAAIANPIKSLRSE